MLFEDEGDSGGAGVSEPADRFIAGLPATRRRISAVTAPTVNSLPRLIKTGSMTGFTWLPV